MNKEIYLIRGNDDESYAQFKYRISDTVSKLAKETDPEAVKFTITEKAPPALAIIPFSKKKIAVISVYEPSSGFAEVAKNEVGFCGGYGVDEAVPVAYKKNWNDGDPTPGACLLTLFRSKKYIEYSAFTHRWYNVHTPHSLVIHPLWNYVRNEVRKKLYDDTVWFDGIVEEQMQEESQLLNPFKFWGNPLVILPRMIKELIDTKSFIDYSSMETYLTTEYVIKSGSIL